MKLAQPRMDQLVSIILPKVTEVKIVETATAVAQQLQRQLQQQQVAACPSQKGRIRFLSSDSDPAAQALFSDLWQKPLIVEGWQ